MRTFQDKKVDIRKLKERVADKWEERMAAHKGITKEIWFKTMEAERVRTIKDVTRLMDFEVEHVVKINAGLTVEDTGTGDTGRLPGSYPR